MNYDENCVFVGNVKSLKRSLSPLAFVFIPSTNIRSRIFRYSVHSFYARSA